MPETEGFVDGTLLRQVAEGIAWFTLNRPDAGNALTPDQRNTLIDLLHQADLDPDVRAVVIASTGKHFCTGADLRAPQPQMEEAEDGGDPPPGTVMRVLAAGAQRLVAAVLDCQKPVVAAVNGTAAGIGAHLVLACDLVVAAEEASFI